MRWALALVLLSACALTPLREARRMGLHVDGPRSAQTLHVVGVDVVVHEQAPLTGAAQQPIVLPAMPPLDAGALTEQVVTTLGDVASARGLTVVVSDPEPWAGALPDDLPQRLADVPQERDTGAVLLRVHVLRCLDGEQVVMCVRSPDEALGYGPPAIDGRVFAKLKTASDGVFARRVTAVSKRFVYRIDHGVHHDKPFLGRGDTAAEQASDAVQQAVEAWAIVYAGRRGQRVLSDR